MRLRAASAAPPHSHFPFSIGMCEKDLAFALLASIGINGYR